MLCGQAAALPEATRSQSKRSYSPQWNRVSGGASSSAAKVPDDNAASCTVQVSERLTKAPRTSSLLAVTVSVWSPLLDPAVDKLAAQDYSCDTSRICRRGPREQRASDGGARHGTTLLGFRVVSDQYLI